MGQRELVMAMKAMGTPSLEAITANHVQARMSDSG
jgi:hypothetical protein